MLPVHHLVSVRSRASTAPSALSAGSSASRTCRGHVVYPSKVAPDSSRSCCLAASEIGLECRILFPPRSCPLAASERDRLCRLRGRAPWPLSLLLRKKTHKTRAPHPIALTLIRFYDRSMSAARPRPRAIPLHAPAAEPHFFTPLNLSTLLTDAILRLDSDRPWPGAGQEVVVVDWRAFVSLGLT